MLHYLKCSRILRLSAFLGARRNCSTKGNKGLVLGVYTEDGDNLDLTPDADQFDKQCNGLLRDRLKLTGPIKEAKHATFWGIHPEFKCVTVVGIGKKARPYDPVERIYPQREAVRVAAAVGCKTLQSQGIKDIHVEPMEDAEAAAIGSALALWKFQEFKTKKESAIKPSLYTNSIDKNESNWKDGMITAGAQNIARRLMDTPANLMTPTIFSENVEKMFENLDVCVEVHDQKWAKSKKMGSFLSVARGSVEQPKFVELTYSNNKNKSNPYVLIGKGVTFDSGGISIKPSSKMDEMRADMGGAATVVSTLQAIASLKLDVNIKVLVPLVENMPSGIATKPGDVVTAMNGKTICVDNTDAEGRLILADALCYSASFDPKWILDIATLTGAMRVALGNSATGVFTNSDNLYTILEKAGASTGDRVWQFPLWKHYTKWVTDYPAYDINNVGKGVGGGACSAAAFLKEFIPKNVDWMHLDMAGVMGPKDEVPYLSGMTGRPTRTLIEFIKNQI